MRGREKKSEIRISKSETNSNIEEKSEIRNPKSEIRNPKQIRISKAKIRNWKGAVRKDKKLKNGWRPWTNRKMKKSMTWRKGPSFLRTVFAVLSKNYRVPFATLRMSNNWFEPQGLWVRITLKPTKLWERRISCCTSGFRGRNPRKAGFTLDWWIPEMMRFRKKNEMLWFRKVPN